MELKSSLVFFISLFLFLALSLSEKDSCSSSKLLGVKHLIPFNTTSMKCFIAWSSENFILRYANTEPDVWSFILSAPATGSYMAVGFSGAGGMVGSSAVAGWITGGSTGIVKQYYLGGTSPNQCKPNQGNLRVMQNKSVIVSSSSRLFLAFQLSAVRLPEYLVLAAGPEKHSPAGDGFLVAHRNKASVFVDYASGWASEKGIGGLNPARRHGLMGAMGWGLLLPSGAVFARYLKRWDPHWFYYHVCIQSIGFGLGVGAVIGGFGLTNAGLDHVRKHKALGISIVAFGCLQVMALVARPSRESKLRKYWNWYHWFIGRACIACAIANIFLGLSLANESSSWIITYGAFLAAWVLVCLVLEIRMCWNA